MSTSAPGQTPARKLSPAESIRAAIKAIPANRARAETAVRTGDEKVARFARWAAGYAEVLGRLADALRTVFKAPADERLADCFGLAAALREWGDALAEWDGFPEWSPGEAGGRSDPAYPYRHVTDDDQPANVLRDAELKVADRLRWVDVTPVRDALCQGDISAIDLARETMRPESDVPGLVADILAEPVARAALSAVATLAEQLQHFGSPINVDNQPYDFVSPSHGQLGRWVRSDLGSGYDSGRVEKLAWITRGRWGPARLDPTPEKLNKMFPGLVPADDLVRRKLPAWVGDDDPATHNLSSAGGCELSCGDGGGDVTDPSDVTEQGRGPAGLPEDEPIGGKKKDIDGRMLKAIRTDRTRLGWTAQRWADHLNCAKSSVVSTQTWKNIKTLREKERGERADAHRGHTR